MSLEYGIDRTTVGIAPENNRLAARCRASGAFRLRLHDLSAPPSSPAAGPRSPSRPSPAGRRPVRADTRQTLQGPSASPAAGAASARRPARGCGPSGSVQENGNDCTTSAPGRPPAQRLLLYHIRPGRQLPDSGGKRGVHNRGTPVR
jgi:hypothetical protein